MKKIRTKQVTIFGILTAALICISGSPLFAAEISGTVELEGGTPAVGAPVIAYSSDKANIGTASSSGLPPTVNSFSIKSLIKGEWLTGLWKVYAEPPDSPEYVEYTRSDVISVDLSSTTQTLDIGALVLKKWNVRGRVLSSASPVENAEIDVYDDNGNLINSDIEFFTDPNGYFKLELNQDKYEIHVHPPDDSAFTQFGSVRDVCIEVKDTGLVELDDITLPLWAKKITGTVMYGTATVPGVEVLADNWDSDFFRSAITGTNGQFEIYVDGGKWEVSVSQQNDVEWISPDPQDVEFSMDSESETQDLAIDLSSAEGYVTGQILGPKGGALNFGGLSIDAYNQEEEKIYSITPDITLDNAGSFKLPLFAGRYEVSVWVDPRIYPDNARTELPLVNITEGATVNLGNIKLAERDAHIQGNVKGGVEGEAISNAYVDAFDSDGNWFSTRTDSNGYYDLNVPTGSWTVEPWDEGYNHVFTGPSKAIMLTENANTGTVDFNMEKAEGDVDGIIQDQDGNKLTDIRPRVYMRRENTQPLIYEDTENGEFTLNVLSGTVYIGAELPPETGYTFIEEVQHTSGSDPTEPVIIILDKNDSVIKGTFLDPSGNAITGKGGHISASLVGDINAWQQSNINSDDGTYEIKVSAGGWNLAFFLNTEDYISRATESLEVDVEEGETVTKDITLIPLDGFVRGYVLDPGESRAPNTQVWLRNFKDETLIYHARAFTDSKGEFTFKAPRVDIAEGSNVYVGTAVNTTDTEYSEASARRQSYSYRSSSSGYAYSSDYKKRQATEQTVLTLRDADILMEGKVLNSNGSPVDGAFVSAYSEDSQTIQGNTNSEGNYQLSVAQAGTKAGNTWKVSASYREKGDTTYYRSEETAVDTCGSDDVYAVSDLTVAESGTFPPAVTRRFMVEDTWTLTLTNGFHMEIPAHTIPSREEMVLVTVEPIVDRLPHNSENRLVHHGYDIKVIEKDTGKEIFDKFKNDVVISFKYTDEQLAELGVEESELYPARFSELSHMWYPELNFFLDEVNNKITFRTRHFSLWALVTSEPVETVPEPEIDVKGNNTSIADGSITPSASDNTDFGTASVNGSIEKTFTIHNLGTADLTIGSVTFSGTHTSDFSVTTQPDATLAPEATTTFTVNFTPGVEGEKNAEISIASSDCSEKAYNFAIKGQGTESSLEPEIDVQGNNTSIQDGDTTPSASDHTNFGNVPVNGSVERTFTIYNLGTADLTIEAVTFSGTHASDFSVATQPDATVAPEATTPFTVNFTPGTEGEKNAEISIASNDYSEETYNFAIKGQGTESLEKPEMDVQGNDTSIQDNDTTPSVSDHTEFGNAPGRTFEIKNTGTSDLTIGDITFSGVHSSDFYVTIFPISPVAVGSQTLFTIKFVPGGTGTRTAKVSIANNDSDENPYNFAISGTGKSFGDIDGDNDTDLQDLIVVLKIIAGINVEIVNPDADVNGDGTIGLEEAVYILQKIAEQRP